MSTQIIERMWVEVEGDGPAVIAIHGLGGTSNTYQPVMAALSGRRVVRPDLLCSGRSPNSEKPSIAAFAETMARLANVLGIKSAVVIGHSLGSLVAQHLAASHGPLVRKLVLIGGLLEPSDAARNALRTRAQASRADGLAAIADQVMQAGTSTDTKARAPAAAAFVRETVMRQCPEGYARTCEALAGAYAADHARITCPTLLITGEEDQTAPPSLARALSERIAGSVVRIVPKCGHWPTIERPEDIGREFRGFV